MQYSVTPKRLRDCASELESIARSRRELDEEVRQARTRLSRMSGMEAVSRDIRKTLDTLEQQKSQTQDMARAACRLAESYERTERQVTDTPDRTVYRIRRVSSSGGGGSPVTAAPVEPAVTFRSVNEILARLHIVLRIQI